MSEAANRQPTALRVLAAWPALTPLVAFVIAETAQLVLHGADGFHRATLLNGLVYRRRVRRRCSRAVFLIVLYLTYEGPA